MGLIDGPGQRDLIEWQALENRLLLIKPDRWVHGVNTANGLQDVVEADVHVLDGPNQGEVFAGKCYKGGYVWGVALKDQVHRNVGSGRFNLGRLGKGAAKAGNNPPWLLGDPSPEELSLANRYLESDLYRKNTATVSQIDAPAQTPAAAPQAPPAPPASDPWGSAPAPGGQPPSDPWGTTNDQPPF